MAYHRLLFGLAGLGLAGLAATGVAAADLGGMKDRMPDGYSVDYGRGWMVRGRVLGGIPQEDSSGFSVAGADVSIDDSIMPELDVSYFFNRNLAVEVIAAVTPHDIDGEGIIAGINIGDVWLLPPTVLLQYHFDIGHGIKPMSARA